MAARTWTPEQRQRQREAIKRWKPWERSTGPQSLGGKLKSSRNAMVHGLRSNPWRELKTTIRKMTRAEMEAEIRRIMRANGSD